MREVEKSEGNYMSRERPIGKGETENRGNQRSTRPFLVIQEEEKKKKKKGCFYYYTYRYTRCLCYYSTTTTLMNVESSFGSSQRVVTRGSILLLYIFLPRFSPFAFASSSSSSPLGRVLSVSAVALGSV